MGHPHGASFVTKVAVEPSMVSVTLTEQQAGTRDSETGDCLTPHIERITYTVADCVAGYTITTQIRHSVSGSDPAGAYSDVQTGLSCANGTSDYSEATPVNTGGTIDKRWQARVRIIRTSDSQVVSEMESSVHQITTMRVCTP